MIFDTHAHYDDEAFNEDRDKLLLSLPENGIEAVVMWVPAFSPQRIRWS